MINYFPSKLLVLKNVLKNFHLNDCLRIENLLQKYKNTLDKKQLHC